MVPVYHEHYFLGSSARHNPFDSCSFSAYYNKDRYRGSLCISGVSYVADTGHDSSDEAWTPVVSDSLTNLRFDRFRDFLLFDVESRFL
jgi:hypothetical protein